MPSDATSNFLANFLKWTIFASTVVPLIIFKEYISPFHFGKVIVFRSIVEIMLAAYLLLIWRESAYRPKFTKITWAFLAFVIAFSITTMTSVIPYASFWGTLERMGGLFTFWHYFVFFIILTSIFKTEKDWMHLLNVTLFVGVISAFYGFLQKTDADFIVGAGGRSRIFGTVGNAALFAGYQLFCVFLAAMLYFRPSASLNEKILYVSSFLVTGLAVMMTAVRGSILALGVGFLVFALLYSSSYRSRKARKFFLGLMGLLVVFVALALLLGDTGLIQDSGYLKRITDFSLTSETVQTRFWAWQAGFKGWSENAQRMIFGWGPENFNIPFSKYFNPRFYQGIGSETLFDRAHNQFIEVLVTMGLLGFLTYLSIYAFAFKTAWQKLNNEKYRHYGVGLITLLIAYSIHNFFIFDTSANFYVFFTILGFVAFLKTGETPIGQNANHKPKVHKSNVLWGLSSIVVLVIMVWAIYDFNVLPAKANYASTRGIVLSWDGNFAGAVAKFKESVSYDVPGKYEHRNRFVQYVLEYTGGKQLDAEMVEVVNFAIDEEKKNVEENPPDYLPYLYLSRLYITLGKSDPASSYNDLALEQSLRAKDLAPDFVRTYYEIAQAYLNKKDLDKAAEYFKHAVELNPDVGLSIWYWAVVEVERGNVEFGLALIEEILSTGKYQPAESDLNKLIGLYVQRSELEKIEPLLLKLIELSPNNPQYHASLAGLYAQFGRIGDAVAHAKEAAKIDPSFEAEARAFVQSIGGVW